MSADQVERRLAAIFAADVEATSRLMGIDEVATLACGGLPYATGSHIDIGGGMHLHRV